MIDGCAAFGDLEVEHGFGGVLLFRGWAEGDVSALNHESRDQAMERCVVVCAARAEGKEILCGLGDSFAEKLDLQVSLGCMQL